MSTEHTLAENLLRLQSATEDIADAITEKGGTASYSDGLEAMGDKIRAIPNPQPVLTTKTIVQNGTYRAEDDEADGYSEVTVNVSSTTNSGVAHPTGSTTGWVNVSFIANKVYVSTQLSNTSSRDTTATFAAPFQLSNFISGDLTFTIEGYRNSSTSTYTMTVKLVPSNNQIVYKTNQSLAARSVFTGYSSIPT